MEKEPDSLLAGILLINLGVFSIILGARILFRVEFFVATDNMLLDIGLFSVGLIVLAGIFVKGFKIIVKYKSQFRTVGRKKYFAVLLNIIGFLFLGLALLRASIFGSNLNYSFIVIFLLIEIFSFIYYNDLLNRKLNRT